MNLPEQFTEQMKELLKDEYSSYINSFSEERFYGLRVNTGKISAEEFSDRSGFHLQPVAWIPNGFYYQESDRPAKDPYYYAGLYYLQEPSAMTPASLLPIEPGDMVLDLCAAPGGKSTELGARLRGQGMLVANDISNSRAKSLLKNLELFGIPNICVTSDSPNRLSAVYQEFFDKILVDAPCSGEGMFRKDHGMVKSWLEHGPEYYAPLQKEIILQAASMLKPGGYLLYSTCTFAPVENEGSVSWLLENYPEMELLEIEPYEGFSRGNPVWGNGDIRLEKCVRIWPHKMKGEGHFLALLHKSEDAERVEVKLGSSAKLDKKSRRILEEFFEECNWKPDWERTEIRGGKVYLVPELPEKLGGIHFLRNGLYMGEMKKERFEPSQQLAMALLGRDYPGRLSLRAEDERIGRYLKGETILVEEGEATQENGWLL
ncbi:MAG: RsmF rRNA methyltransferase first C-terminal domain-containing protein, partial [Clostridiaceae bacterium]|nr:RsmF rRNA methyltransferase first C-terminal domain-containing protein [Clostridiaceae bacterium]